jgi:hypothetical protein
MQGVVFFFSVNRELIRFSVKGVPTVPDSVWEWYQFDTLVTGMLGELGPGPVTVKHRKSLIAFGKRELANVGPKFRGYGNFLAGFAVLNSYQIYVV